MKRKILAAILSVAMVASVFALSVGASDPSTAPSKDVVNSDANLFKAAGFDVSFEDGTFSPEGWTQGAIVSDVAHSGDKSFLKKDSWGTGGHIIVPNVGIEEGKNYILSFWYYWDGSTQGNATGFLRENSNNGAAIAGVTGTKAVREGKEDSLIWFSGDDDGIWSGKNVGSWVYVERGIAAEKDIMTVCLSFTGQNPYYIDDVCLLEASAVPTPEPAPVVTEAPAPVDGTPVATTAPTAVVGTAAPTTAPTVTPTSSPKPPKKVTIKFKKKSVKIKKGKKVTLKVTIKNAKKATFSVDKKGKKVVKLSKKKAKSVVVTGKKKGKATITAKAGNKKATCKVTVK